MFITPYGAFCYTTMSFGLKNAGTTYQRAIQECFKEQLHRSVEAYVDDVVIKTRNPNDFIVDLEETFASLQAYRWKLNPTKCMFGVPSGKLLEFIITNLHTPLCIKDIQKLTGCMVNLNRFISRLGERGLPFFKLLKRQEKFQWTEKAEQALQHLKDFLSKPPVLTVPTPNEDLLLYIVMTTNVVNTAIVVERPEQDHVHRVQRPIYFVSEVLSLVRSCQTPKPGTR